MSICQLHLNSSDLNWLVLSAEKMSKIRLFYAIFPNQLKEERMSNWLGVVHLSVDLVIFSETGTIVFVQFQDFKIGTSASASSLRSKILFLGKGPDSQLIY